MAEPIDPQWHKDQVAAYVREKPRYEAFAAALRRVFDNACEASIPERIIQARAKSVASFAEKCVRRSGKYHDPVHQLTDLCGARIVVQTLRQVDAVKCYIEQNFEVIERDNKATLLGADKFGYRDMHYLVRLRPDRAAVVGFTPEETARIGNAVAELQVRSVSQHAWADNIHDRAYKTPFKLSAEAKRTAALLAAVMEDGDLNFDRFTKEIDGIVVNYTAYAGRQDVLDELRVLELVFEHEADAKKKAALAVRLARLLGPLGDFERVIELLDPFAQLQSPWRNEVLLELGHAYCHHHRFASASAEFKRGQAFLEQVVAGCQCIDYDAVPDLRKRTSVLAKAYSRLGWSWEIIGTPSGKALDYHRKAAETEPDNPYYLTNQLGFEIHCSPNKSVVQALAASMNQAVAKCHEHALAGTEIPNALFTAGRLRLLQDKATAALGWYARAVQHLLDQERCIFTLALLEDEEKWIRRLNDALPQPPAQHEWIIRLMALARRVFNARHGKTPSPVSSGGTHVLILAGGAGSLNAELAAKIKPVLKIALAHFRGLLISGGTTAGIPGCVGEVAAELRKENRKHFELVGYVPRLLPANAPKSPHYDRFVDVSDEDDFSPAQILQCWEDLLNNGVSPHQVRLLGFGGGIISSVEYRVAFALGASVAVVENTGGAADEILANEVWAATPPVMGLPFDAASIQAYVTTPTLEHSQETLETMAQAFHSHYVRDNPGNLPRILQPWSKLTDTYKAANLDQARYAVEILRASGFDVRRASGAKDAISSFAGDDFRKEVETMARLEHGRWNVERLRDGWRFGRPRDDAKRRHDSLVTWIELPDSIREFDRNAVHAFPEILAKANLEIFRKPAAAS